jgi:hypothetical protein
MTFRTPFAEQDDSAATHAAPGKVSEQSPNRPTQIRPEGTKAVPRVVDAAELSIIWGDCIAE